MADRLQLRRYRPTDTDRVLELHEDAMRDVGAFVESVTDPDLENVGEVYLDSGGEFLVGERDGRIVAMGAFRPATGYITDFLDGLPDRTAELKRMRVDPAYQQQGYGQQVYDELEQRARERRFAAMVLDTSPNQVGAQRFYEKNGFKAVHREHLEFDGDPFELICYLKSLD